MASESMKSEIKDLLVERLFLRVKPEDIPDEAPLLETLGIDSVALFELVVGLEDVYGITFEEDEFRLSLFNNVNSIADFVENKQA
ncbi:MAG TPA: acyl carrier protein [Armatimonadota bacterium]|jgi:acyl carrier protein|nr:acyl carrier protein [Armatimonadota bacterium]